MIKKILTVSLGVLLLQGAQAAIPFYDGFDYSTGNLGAVGGAGGWDSASSSLIAVASGSLTGPTGFPESAGNMITLGKGSAVNFTTFANNGQLTSGQVYFSFLFKPGSSSGASSTGLDIAALTAQDSSTPAINVRLRNNSGFKMGAAKAGGTAAYPTATLAAGTNYLVVGKYDFSTSPNTVSLWVLTTFSSTEAGAGAAAVIINGGTDFSAASGIGRFYLNGAGVPTASVNIDELRIGTSWAQVTVTNDVITPPPPAVTNAPVVTQILMTTDGIVLRGTNGTTNGTFEVLASTDVSQPLNQWDALGTFSFDSNGHFDCTNPVSPGVPKSFYILKTGGSLATAPSITGQPQNQSVIIGQDAAFSVVAEGGTPLSYQWYFNTNTPLAGQTAATLTINDSQESDQGAYSVIVSNSLGSVTSVVAMLTVSLAPTNGTYYVATNGSDSNPGSFSAPFATLPKAVSVVLPGETIYVRGGSHFYSQTIRIEKSGTAADRINLLAYPGEQPLLDFVNQPYGASNRGILFTTNGNYWNVKGLEIARAGDNAIKVEGSHLRFEQCVLHHNGDTGLQIGFGHPAVNNINLAAFVEVINCDSYLNYDPDSNGGDADGFAAKLHCGQGIVFMGCRAWENSDDGWDLFETDASVIISNCWTWKSAFVGQGNGNGFKMGGDGTGGSSKGTHYAWNCVAFGCKVNGFTMNSHKDGEVVINCLSFSNGASGYNFYFEGSLNSGKQNVFKNNVGILRNPPSTGNNFSEDNSPLEVNNTWNLAVTPNSADYVSILESAAKAPRQLDGSLPTGFARLVSGSDLIDKGVNVGIPFTGSAPDLGPYEYAP